MNVAYEFTNPPAASYQFAQMIILPQLQARTPDLDVVAMLFGDDDVWSPFITVTIVPARRQR